VHVRLKVRRIQRQGEEYTMSTASKISAYLQAYLETGFFMGSALVAHAGEVILHQSYGMANLEHAVYNTSLTKFRIASVTKPFTAAAILKLQEQGLLHVQHSIAAYVPHYPNSEQITIHHLLTHTSGIPDFTGLPDAQKKEPLKVTLDELISWFSNKPLDFMPGDRYRPSNSGYVLLAKIIEVASGQFYADYLQQHILEPANMLDSGYDQQELVLPHRASGYLLTETGYRNPPFWHMSQPSGAGGMYSTTGDLYKWDQALYGDTVLSEQSRNTMVLPLVRMGTWEPKQYCGYGWLVDTRYGRDRQMWYGAINGFRAVLSRYPSEKAVVIVLSNVGDVSIERMESDIAAILFNEPYRMPTSPQAIQLDSAVYEAYVGEYGGAYDFAPRYNLMITTDSKHIFMNFPGEDRKEIFPASSTEFFLKVLDLQLTFRMDETGKASSVIIHQNGEERVATKID
jgi:CubicO group peptidase (beta-lactamase class C family)